MRFFRALVFNALFFGVTPCIAAYALLRRALGDEDMLRFAVYWARFMVASARRVCGITVAVSGAEHLPAGGAALIASQHQSAFDTIIWFTLVDRPSYIVKEELTRIPIFGALLRPAGMIPVDRSAGATALRNLVQATFAAQAEARQIIIFPEGTRVAPGQSVPLQPGVAAIAARLGLPVIPVATDSGLLWGRRAFRKTPGVLHIAVGKPLPPDMKRADLLGAIEGFWHQQTQAGFGAVDKSVGKPGMFVPATADPCPQGVGSE
jgi:1-acyl-sn-glycerol-3-phosphate acyltransferase